MTMGPNKRNTNQTGEAAQAWMSSTRECVELDSRGSFAEEVRNSLPRLVCTVFIVPMNLYSAGSDASVN